MSMQHVRLIQKAVRSHLVAYPTQRRESPYICHALKYAEGCDDIGHETEAGPVADILIKIQSDFVAAGYPWVATQHIDWLSSGCNRLFLGETMADRHPKRVQYCAGLIVHFSPWYARPYYAVKAKLGRV